MVWLSLRQCACNRVILIDTRCCDSIMLANQHHVCTSPTTVKSTPILSHRPCCFSTVLFAMKVDLGGSSIRRRMYHAWCQSVVQPSDMGNTTVVQAQLSLAISQQRKGPSYLSQSIQQLKDPSKRQGLARCYVALSAASGCISLTEFCTVTLPNRVPV